MRNKVQLYIEGVRADLDENAFLLLNYTQEDLSNPTIVKNSFSKQITLKGTPANDAIFGHLHRNDRNTLYGSPYNGPYFDPCRKTSFVIYNEAQEIIESGYLKLDSVKTNGRKHSFVCTLYGGLGSFLFGLSYDASGEKLTLADLDFGETLDFVIDRDAVSDAWTRLLYGTGPTKWDIINFIPTAYTGLPPAPFDASKCLVNVAATGLKDNLENYASWNGLTIATLNDKVTGNACKDFRSYLQKPCIKMSAIIDAICDPSNNGGWTVNQDAEFFDSSNPYWDRVWLTLPALNDLNIDSTTVTNTQSVTALDTMISITGGGGSGVYNVTVNAQPYVDMSGVPSGNYKMYTITQNGFSVNNLYIVLRLYDSGQSEIASARYAITTFPQLSSEFPCDFTFDHIDTNGYFVNGGGTRVTFPISAEAVGAAYFKVSIETENYFFGVPADYPGDLKDKMWPSGASAFTPNYNFAPTIGQDLVDISGVSTSSVRTGATITQAALLGGGSTPADYLLSYCKMFGIQMVAHKDTKTVDLILRKNLYSSTVVDLGGRIDRGKEIMKKPFAFDARWYLFGNEAKGEFAQYFKSKYNRNFGEARVNTGYEFDAAEKGMTKDIIFSNACSVLETSPFFCNLVLNGKDVPAVFLSGGKYTLYNGNENKTFDIPYLTNAAKTWLNPSYPMHDYWEKLQLHGDQDAHLDERDTLVFFEGMLAGLSSLHYSLTDDTKEMLYLNGNTPCWLPNWCDVEPTWAVDEIPYFSRYRWNGTTISKSLDWGDPLELQIPGAVVGSGSNIFDQYWDKYIGDRYDDDSAVVTCYVDLRGFQVNENLFRQFYAFDGCIWSLNRIIDHSLTTFGPTKCEFVKVQDKINYTTY